MPPKEDTTIQLTDIEGKAYATSQDQLLAAARQCIRERFAQAACIGIPAQAKAHL